MLIDSGSLFTNQLFQCYTAVDHKQFEYAELLVWLVIENLKSNQERCNRLIEYYNEPRTEIRSIMESALFCLQQREGTMNHVMEDLNEHRPW